MLYKTKLITRTLEWLLWLCLHVHHRFNNVYQKIVQILNEYHFISIHPCFKILK